MYPTPARPEMDANDLMHYLKCYAELINSPPTPEQWGIMRAKIKGTVAVQQFFQSSLTMADPARLPVLDKSKLPGGCGCL